MMAQDREYCIPRHQLQQVILKGTIRPDIELLPEVSMIRMKNTTLYRHQLNAIQVMTMLEKRCNIDWEEKYVLDTTYGWFCDKVGSGKSLVILGLITSNPILSVDHHHQLTTVDYSCYDTVGFRLMKRHSLNFLQTNLIVVPISLYSQWVGYIQRFTDLTLFQIKRNADAVRYCELSEESKNQSQVVLVSNTAYRYLADKINRRHSFSRVIFDEVDTIDIPNTPIVNAGFYWFVTASVSNVIFGRKRNHGFLHHVFQMNRSIYNKFLYVKNNDEHVDESMNLAPPIINTVLCKLSWVLAILGNVIPSRVQMMISGGDIPGAMNELNIFNDTCDNIVKIATDSLTRQLLNAKARHEMTQQMFFSTPEEKELLMREQARTIVSLEEKIAMVRERIEKSDDVDPITFDPIENAVITKCCQNKFEAKSLLGYIGYHSGDRPEDVFCPMCKHRPFGTSGILHISENKNNNNTTPGDYINKEWKSEEHGKIENLENLYNTGRIQKNDRVLIMTEYNSEGVIRQLAEMLDRHQIRWGAMHNHHHTRGGVTKQSLIHQYLSHEKDVLLLNALYYGTGLNLEITDHVVFLHRMTFELETQVIGRAQRVGRKSTLQVWKLFDEYEMLGSSSSTM